MSWRFDMVDCRQTMDFGVWGEYFIHGRAGTIENLHELTEVIGSLKIPAKIKSQTFRQFSIFFSRSDPVHRGLQRVICESKKVVGSRNTVQIIYLVSQLLN